MRTNFFRRVRDAGEHQRGHGHPDRGGRPAVPHVVVGQRPRRRRTAGSRFSRLVRDAAERKSRRETDAITMRRRETEETETCPVAPVRAWAISRFPQTRSAPGRNASAEAVEMITADVVVVVVAAAVAVIVVVRSSGRLWSSRARGFAATTHSRVGRRSSGKSTTRICNRLRAPGTATTVEGNPRRVPGGRRKGISRVRRAGDVRVKRTAPKTTRGDLVRRTAVRKPAGRDVRRRRTRKYA